MSRAIAPCLDAMPFPRLRPRSGKIGVHLTEGYMMEPEGFVSALAFHCPDARTAEG